MLYLDNAATSRFKPQAVIDCINYDLRHSANSGRGAYPDAIDAGLKIEACREYLKYALHADDSYNVIFTKNCTEALNLGIFGIVKGGERVLTSTNEHNSVLRPLYELERRGMISLTVLDTHGGKINTSELKEAAIDKDIIVLGGACNVTGATLDLREVGKIANDAGAMLIVDGAQSVPILETDMSDFGIDMLACAGHKGLHGVQGTGFLITRKAIAPLLYGGTGSYSSSVYQPVESVDGFEAGTLFAGGIAALHQGAKWSYEHIDTTRKHIAKLTKTALYNLKMLGATLYTDECVTGVIAFNVKDVDSTYISELLSDNGIAVRSGLHCAPLVHKALGTTAQGAVRISLGVETTSKDILYFSNVMENIIRKL
ncbi:MAG: aminotransferase class V-fold PLP-dependent enzyme [Clostridia bacterium]|nr:aminotransferase class V-fold PLP-dependent enzyme [Clostridia bacterium]